MDAVASSIKGWHGAGMASTGNAVASGTVGGCVELRSGDRAGDRAPAVVLAVPLLAHQARAGEQRGDPGLVWAHPEREHGAEGEVSLGVRGVSRAVARPE